MDSAFLEKCNANDNTDHLIMLALDQGHGLLSTIPKSYRGGHRSWSYSPAPRRGHDYSVSPRDKHHRSPANSHDSNRSLSPVRRSYSSQRSPDGKKVFAGNGNSDSVPRSPSVQKESQSPISPRRFRHSSYQSCSKSPSGSHSRSADSSASD